MSHGTIGMDPGISPLATYNSLTDGHLAGFYASPRKRRHLRKVGLISRSGHLISENTFRLNMAKKDRRRQIKNTLAQAIVEKTLELDRHRQNVIKQKLEEIAKMELVQRVRTSETELRKRNQEMLPYLSPRSPRRPTSGPAPNKTGSSTQGKYRPISAPLNNRPTSSSTKTSTNYDDYDDEGDVEYIDVNGESSSPRQNSYREDHTLDLNQLYTLNTVALRKYAMTLARLEKGQNGTSPYTTASTIPMPPRSPRNVTSARRRKYNSGANSDRSPQRTSAANKNHLHTADSVTVHPGQLQSMVEVRMKYHGWNLSLARDEIDPRNLVVVEQQHCGGNTLTVFKQKLHPGSDFTFVSHRHRGYPFSLTIYVDGRMDSRVSTCCEYRHAKKVRLGGANGHFSIVDVKGNTPCFKCRVERGGKKKKKKKSKPEPMVEEIVVKKSVHESVKEEKNSDTESEDTGNYEDDFEQSDNEQKQDGDQNEDEDEAQSQIKQEEQPELQEKTEDDLEIEEARIRGMSLDSPRDSGNRTPDSDKIQEEEQVYGRKIDAYSSEEEDLNGPDSKIVEVEQDDEVAMTIKIKKGKSQSSGEKSQKDLKKEELKRKEMKTSKSAPSNTSGSGKKKAQESKKRTDESSESEELTPRRQQILTPLSTEQSSKTPSPQNQPGSPGTPKHLEGQTKPKDSPKKVSKPPSPAPKPTPVASPEFLHTVWDEDSEVVQSPDDTTEDWNQKKEKLGEQIMKEFGKKEEDLTYMADDEDTERTEQTLGRGTSEGSNEPVARVVLHTYPMEQEQEDETESESDAGAIMDTDQNKDANFQSKAPLIAEAILKTYGNDPKTYNEESQKSVANAIIDAYGKDSESKEDANAPSKDLKGDAPEENITEQILKQFGGDSHSDSSPKINSDDSQQLDPEKRNRISEEMLLHFGQDPVKPNLEEDQPSNARISEEILKQFGGNDKNERVAEEIVKLYGQNQESSSDKLKESTSREWRTETEVKKTGASENEQHSDYSESTTSTEKEIRNKKRESQVFFQPAIEIRNQQEEASKSKISDSSMSEGEITNQKSSSLTVKSSELSTSTQSSAVTPDTTTQESVTTTKSGSSKTAALVSESEDSSSDSDSDTTSESDSDSSLTTSSSSDSDTETNTNTSARTPRPPDNGIKAEQTPQDGEVKAEQTPENNESRKTSNVIVADKEIESNEEQVKEESKETNAKPSKSVTFRNTPEPFTYHVSDTESENMQYGGNDPDQVGDGEPGQRPATSMNTSVKLHGGSIKHLLQDATDIHLDSISLDKHQMEEICDDIKSKSEVKTLSLRNCNLKDEDIENISEALITSPSEPVMLNLNLNDLTSNGMHCIVDIMKNEPTLDVLLLQGNYIGDEGVRILCQGIISIHHEARQKRKQSLIRQNSQLQMEDSVQIHADEAGNRMPPSLNIKRRSSLFDPAREARFCRLGELDIGDVGLTDKGIEFISLLLEANVYLETLSLSSNPGVSKNGWLRLGQALEKNRRLQNLTLDFNVIGDDAMTFLCRGLKDNHSLTALDLEETHIGERGGRILLELLKRNTTLLDITLTPGNDIPDSVVSEIRRFLALNKAASY